MDSQPSRHEVWKMFDRIAPRYDALNRILSLRSDIAWRKKLARLLPPRGRLLLLDLATGTGDQIFHLLEATNQIERALGLDLSEGMLAIGREKVEKLGLAGRVELRAGDAMSIPVPDDAYDLCTMSFGIRNVLDVSHTLREIRRTLKPGGRALILECSLPKPGLLRSLYLFYLRHVLPRLGGLISGDATAYRYLNVTIEGFPSGEDFCRLMRDAGFRDVRAHPLTLGAAMIYQGDK